MQPRFHRRYIERHARAMTDVASRKSRQWRDGAMVDVEQEMRDLTLRIVAKTLFDIETDDVVQRVGEAFTESDAYLYLRLTQPVFLRRLLHNLPLPSTRRFRAARAYVDELIYGLIEERRRSGAEGDDLLRLLMQARYEDAEGGETAAGVDGVTWHEYGEGLGAWRQFGRAARGPQVVVHDPHRKRLHGGTDGMLRLAALVERRNPQLPGCIALTENRHNFIRASFGYPP